APVRSMRRLAPSLRKEFVMRLGCLTIDRRTRVSAGLSAVLALLALTLPLHAEDWPQYRGPNCTGVSTSKKSLPLHFSRTKNVRWSAVLGDGIGSPAVVAGRVDCPAMAGQKGGGGGLGGYCCDARA